MLFFVSDPRVIQFYGVSFPSDRGSPDGSSRSVLLVTELAEGSLDQYPLYLQTTNNEKNEGADGMESLPRSVSVGGMWEVIVQIIDGMVYLHSRNVFHRDIKPQVIEVSHVQHSRSRIYVFVAVRTSFFGKIAVWKLESRANWQILVLPK